jgi:hypothetical protein
MTLRGWALYVLLLSMAAAVAVNLASVVRFRLYHNLIAAAAELQAEATKSAPRYVTEARTHQIDAPRGRITSNVVQSPEGEPLRVQCFRNGTLVIEEQMGQGRKRVRRDLYYDHKIRVSQFFDLQGDIYQVWFLDAEGKVIHEILDVYPPPPGWHYL